MLPLFEMMMKAQNGEAMGVLARQFGLAQEQMASATAALMPAFSAAFKRNATNPYDFGALLQAMASGNHVRYFEDLREAFTPQGMADGNGILGQLFGSKEVSRAIAAQAAQMTGIGQEIYKQMLPVMASSIMGGLFKQMTGEIAQKPFDAAAMFSQSPMAAWMKPWMDAAGDTTSKPAAPPFENPFLQAMQFAMKPQDAAAKAPTPADLFSANPFFKAFGEMMRGPAALKEEAKVEETSPASQFAAMMSSMFESGIEAQKEYQKAIDGLIGTYSGRKA
ncbi:DUF937 domain-containing protein [Ensifer soli]|uniref:DUF937 domain-containing protein n=1 Tax=Ciceribacter sp. sgz301302 TaxID=3342379 RepID=UPI0035B8FE5B